MKIILFLAAVYALIINQCQQKTTAIIPSANNIKSIARDTTRASSTAQYNMGFRKSKSPGPAAIQYSVLRPMLLKNY